MDRAKKGPDFLVQEVQILEYSQLDEAGPESAFSSWARPSFRLESAQLLTPAPG
jgi:hypothetical protein